jgi:hypothetical protein
MNSFLKSLAILGPVLSLGLTFSTASAASLPAPVLGAMERALDDEWHAESFYAAVIDKHGNVRPFSKIIRAEQRHVGMLIRLFRKYGAAVPANPYEDGSKAKPSAPATLAEACKIGVEAEIANRDLYAKDLIPAATGHDDVLAVFEALRAASENNHLPAFQRCGGNS